MKILAVLLMYGFITVAIVAIQKYTLEKKIKDKFKR